MVKSWHQNLNCWATVMIFFPTFKIEKFNNEVELFSYLSETKTIRRICFTIQEPITNITTPYEFMEKNSNSLCLDLGETDDQGIRESFLTTKSNDNDAIKK